MCDILPTPNEFEPKVRAQETHELCQRGRSLAKCDTEDLLAPGRSASLCTGWKARCAAFRPASRRRRVWCFRIAYTFACQSARGLAHSKTLARPPMCQETRSVLECGSPLPLLTAGERHCQFASDHFSASGLGSAGVAGGASFSAEPVAAGFSSFLGSSFFSTRSWLRSLSSESNVQLETRYTHFP
jgi:hypothetical protein